MSLSIISITERKETNIGGNKLVVNYILYKIVLVFKLERK